LHHLLILLITSQRYCFFNFKNHSTASNGRHSSYMKCVGFPWPPVVAAHNRKRLGWAYHSRCNYWLQKNYPYNQDSVMSIRFYHLRESGQ